MTPAEFRRAALGLPGVVEREHMSHPDFRVGGKIFATLGYPDGQHGMVNLPADEQARLVKNWPNIFSPAKGAWGKSGSTTIRLDQVDTATLTEVIERAWRKRAPKHLR